LGVKIKVLPSLLYNGPLLILAAFWIFYRKQEQEKFQFIRVLVDIAILSMAVSRFYGLPIPPSGHALFLTHSLVSVRNKYYRIAALVMLIVTIMLKLSWGDYRSWFYGVIIGLVSATIWIQVGKARVVTEE
jgi:hypothetical protein